MIEKSFKVSPNFRKGGSWYPPSEGIITLPLTLNLRNLTFDYFAVWKTSTVFESWVQSVTVKETSSRFLFSEHAFTTQTNNWGSRIPNPIVLSFVAHLRAAQKRSLFLCSLESVEIMVSFLEDENWLKTKAETLFVIIWLKNSPKSSLLIGHSQLELCLKDIGTGAHSWIILARKCQVSWSKSRFWDSKCLMLQSNPIWT